MPIGIMSAIPEENRRLVEALEGPEDVVIDGMREYHSGTLFGEPVVLVFSRCGKVAAATTATALISRFDVRSIVFTGVAGSLSSDVRVGDIVVADRLVQHDMDASPLFDAFEIPLLHRSYFDGDRGLTRALIAGGEAFVGDLASHVTPDDLAQFAIGTPRVSRGLVLSGDQFVTDRAYARSLCERLPGALCVEMEGAAVAQVCFEYGRPCGVVRVISDAADETAAFDFTAFVDRVATHFSYGILEHALPIIGGALRAR